MATGDKTIIAKKSQVDALNLRVGANENSISTLDSRNISTTASNALMGNMSLQYTVDYAEATDTTTRDYVVGDLVSDGTNKVVVECIADSTSGELLTNTDYFTVKGTNGLVFSNAVFTFTNGKDNNGYIVTTEKLNDGIYVPSSTADGLQWLYKVKGNAMPYLTKFKPMNSLYNKEFADDNRLVFNTSDGKFWITKGGNLITNGTFDANTDGWTAEDAVVMSIDNGMLKVDITGDYVGVLTTIDVIVGEKYEINYEYIADGYMNMAIADNDSNIIYQQGWVNGTSGSNTAIFTATTSSLTIRFYNSTADTTFRLDNISIYKKQATLDAPLETPVSFLSNPVFYSNGVPQYIDKSKSLASVVVDTLEVSDITLKTVNGQHPAMLGIGGEGYSWTNVLDDRTDGVTYTNDTGKPIMVSILLIAAGNNRGDPTGGSIEINGDDYLLLQLRNDNGDYVMSNLTFLVPPNDTYELTLNTNGSISRWFELR